MESLGGEDEKKPFDAEQGPDEDFVPDPQEVLFFDHRAPATKCWMVKIPKFLMERWSAVDRSGQRLATIRVYTTTNRAVLTVPIDPNMPDGEVEKYDLPVGDRQVHNTFVVTNRLREPGNRRSRAYESRVIGRVAHEGILRPTLDAAHRARIKARTYAAAAPTRQVVRIEDAIEGGQGAINRLTAGAANTGGFADLVKHAKKPAKGQFERMARIPRNQLLDLLFAFFREQPYWRLQDLRQRTQQPEAYLKEVLSDIATLNRAGEHASMWELKPNFVEADAKGEAGQAAAGLYQMPYTKAEDYNAEDDDEEEEEEDDDMEEVT